ncbi:hypothetical protein JOD31_003702 [Methylopila capsulata]|uniref:Uncharacterized protein n=1 Tax=Methylopila capsulata TaxID=61654 RepID=A0A9W6IY78_9HYPH|nr:hypothetical protein [Methylopila capsulata]MBM7853441.1 hypothetical protein [Methylopila capsulata]GLK57345.1 hypothetical protein GCM10008170_33650 [Methylopila capsulata]
MPPLPNPARAPLTSAVAAELAAPQPEAVRAFAAELAARGGGGVAGVLFYGSALRTGETDGLLDFYVLLDDLAAWNQSRFATAGNRLLPPNVEYAESAGDAPQLRAKVAIMSVAQFARHARALSRDTTIWTRFCQPAALPYARDEAAARAIADAVATAVGAAAWWAAHLGPERGPAAAFWTALFQRTYASELRVESAARPSSIVERAPERFARMLTLGWAAEGVPFATETDGALSPRVAPESRAKAAKAWARRRRLAKPLNLARLAKAVFTFSGGVDYIAWKIERHSGHAIVVTPFQRRHPLLSAGPVLWRLWRRGVLR